MRTLMWFRDDLRLLDNKALYHAAKTATDGMVAVFFIVPKLWKKSGYDPNKIDFIIRNLKTLAVDLEKKKIPLIIKKAETQTDIRQQLLHLVNKYKIKQVYYNAHYSELFNSESDATIEKFLTKQKIDCFSFEDETILPPKSVLTASNDFYTIFTPFKNKWLEVFEERSDSKVLSKPKKQNKIFCQSNLKALSIDSRVAQQLKKMWPAGEKEAQKRLKKFVQSDIFHYDKNRDYPSLDGTSRLSPYLACGVISPRVCLQSALKAKKIEGRVNHGGVTTWISELIWRDFYKHLLFAHTRLFRHKPFKQYKTPLKWKKDRKLFNQWKRGETGFPIVDAAMKQLNQTGWMHNRLRMVVASFLTKLLFIDWRWGEAYFAEKLIDYDFSANNGGWQWSASTGADSVPYFRIFNPEIQQKKYDPEFDFVKTFLGKRGQSLNPIINYKKSRIAAIKAFKR